MEVSFDDILRDFDRDTRPEGFDLTELKRRDLAELTQAWISERMCPELLDYKEDLLERLLERIRQQVEFIEMNSIELQTAEKDIKLHLMIVESELDRVNFLIRSYLRTRLSKIDKYTVHIRTSEDVVKRLSAEETTYMENHFKALVQLYNSLFLSQMPEHLQALDDTGGGMSMIEEPDMDSPVFVKMLDDVVDTIYIGDEEIDLVGGGIYLIRYSAVRSHVLDGRAILI
ncbi:CYFA0S07e02982g1_1 [Cyberlindnera fabianii]|uniref:DNA replication complex GINS protein SLD5 n=1 Tax=Cyberlindnera fabianii TaxID=36022 RepID=A0A061AVE0_CYBFA|nr:DNA replication complex GINS protein SLD5 [Cyberlindnera fabianii]CDR41507.1 CYFA0S07e02982g1_1 [Cyberlindnera fabianii]